MQCSNNLKQIGLGLLNHEDIHHAFPSQSRQYGAASNGTPSFFTPLLPFIEQGAVYDKFISEHAANGNFPYGIHQISATDHPDSFATAKISSFLCPSDGESYQKLNPAPGMLNYRVCVGDLATGRDQGNGMQRGIAGGTLGMARSNVTLAMITDGTSNTLGFSEHCIGTNTASPRSGVAYQVSGVFGSITIDTLDGTSTKSDWLIRPDLCLTAVQNGQIKETNRMGYLLRPSSAPLFPISCHGASWAEGSAIYMLFATCLPPNSPSCSANTVKDRPAEARGLFPPTSNHVGGVNCSYVDGSIHFISETINCGDTTAPGSNPTGYKSYLIGPSPYGIFGALGTLQGGETSSL
jgi:hypothetical protein